MLRLGITNCNTILTQNQQKYWHYRYVKLINMNSLQVTKYYLLNKMYGREIYSGIITLNYTFEKQMNLKIEIDNFDVNAQSKKNEWKRKKE